MESGRVFGSLMRSLRANSVPRHSCAGMRHAACVGASRRASTTSRSTTVLFPSLLPRHRLQQPRRILIYWRISCREDMEEVLSTTESHHLTHIVRHVSKHERVSKGGSQIGPRGFSFQRVQHIAEHQIPERFYDFQTRGLGLIDSM